MTAVGPNPKTNKNRRSRTWYSLLIVWFRGGQQKNYDSFNIVRVVSCHELKSCRINLHRTQSGRTSKYLVHNTDYWYE